VKIISLAALDLGLRGTLARDILHRDPPPLAADCEHDLRLLPVIELRQTVMCRKCNGLDADASRELTADLSAFTVDGEGRIARPVPIRRRDPAEAAERIRAGYRDAGIPEDVAEAMIGETLRGDADGRLRTGAALRILRGAVHRGPGSPAHLQGSHLRHRSAPHGRHPAQPPAGRPGRRGRSRSPDPVQRRRCAVSESPPNPFNHLAQAAVATHEMFSAYVDAGFTRAEALQLVAAIITAPLRGERPPSS
jgi:hypothetical protein